MPKMVQIDDVFINADQVLYIRSVGTGGYGHRSEIIFINDTRLQCTLWPSDVAALLRPADPGAQFEALRVADINEGGKL